MSNPQKTALVTGGSSGIGLELSVLLAQAGYQLLWVARTEAELKTGQDALLARVPGAQLKNLACDLSVAGAAKRVHDWASAEGETPDILINNAGFGTYGWLQDIEAAREEAMIGCNVLALHGLTRAFLPDMLARNSGHIVHLSSNSALQPVPRLATYSATKAFVLQFSESLRQELAEQGSAVMVTSVCPAATRGTAFQNQAGMDGVRTFASIGTTTPQEVAADIWRGIQNGTGLVLTGARFRRLHALGKFLPAFIHRAVIRRELQTTN
jgi:short-subunit dehydrogenase